MGFLHGLQSFRLNLLQCGHLSTGCRSCQKTCSSVGSPQAAAPFKASPSALVWGPPQAAAWISAPPWSSTGCRGTPASPRSKINLHFLLYMQVVIRRLPPCLTKEQLEEQLHPLPAHDYFEFCTADPR
uniref:UPF3 domain-containing protein n=1 Tax=Buteo japonicus TaxID=224669 RepID=A0A8C0C0H8_9AVES